MHLLEWAANGEGLSYSRSMAKRSIERFCLFMADLLTSASGDFRRWWSSLWLCSRKTNSSILYRLLLVKIWHSSPNVFYFNVIEVVKIKKAISSGHIVYIVVHWRRGPPDASVVWTPCPGDEKTLERINQNSLATVRSFDKLVVRDTPISVRHWRPFWFRRKLTILPSWSWLFVLDPSSSVNLDSFAVVTCSGPTSRPPCVVPTCRWWGGFFNHFSQYLDHFHKPSRLNGHKNLVWHHPSGIREDNSSVSFCTPLIATGCKQHW